VRSVQSVYCPFCILILDSYIYKISASRSCFCWYAKDLWFIAFCAFIGSRREPLWV